ncbi:hypothetical protein C6A37_04210 [Desulfobacteraceae bacterium SEEP-SAG9]|nr:hypothetical protein C6A37_04210 [Desulfobacteraceae bacterium SEEP-SAG9]
MRIRNKELGFQSGSTLTSVQNLGMALSGLGHVGPALECYNAQKKLGLAAGLQGQFYQARSNHETLALKIAQGFPYASNFRQERVDIDPVAALLRVLDECEQMLHKGPESSEKFVLEYGQAGDVNSYNKLVYTLKSQLNQAFKSDELSHEIEDLVQDARRVQKRLVVSCRVPLTHFSGYLNRITRDSLGPISQTTLDCAFPNFEGSREARQRRDALLAKYGVNPNAIPTLLQHRKKTLDKIEMFEPKTIDRQFRRYAGDHNLPSQRYAAVCSENSNTDQQTLARELFEYTDPQVPGLIFVCDTSDTELLAEISTEEIQKVTAGREGIFVFLIPPPEEEKLPFFREIFGLMLEQLHGPYSEGNDRWDSLSIVFIPVERKQVDVPNILDLRQRATQDWFWRFFQHGDGAIFVKEEIELIYGFGDMLPALVYPEYGGSGVTKSVGSWLRTIGASGLIFPSARSDASVRWDGEDKLVTWRGWNFVDYRGLQYAPDSLAHFDLNPWYDFVPGRQEAPVLESDERSWTIRGVEWRYNEVRDILLQILRNPNTSLM